MEHPEFTSHLVAATDHLRTLLIRKTRTDRIIGRPGLRPSWAPPSYVASGPLGGCDLGTVTGLYYNVEKGLVDPAEVVNTWRRAISAARARESVASVVARDLADQLPGMVVASTPPKAALTQLAEYSAIMSMVVGSIKATHTRIIHDLGKVKVEINGNRIYIGRDELYMANRMDPLWNIDRTVDEPCGKRRKPGARMWLVTQRLCAELPQHAKAITWLSRLATYTNNEREIVRGFDVHVEGGEDNEGPIEVLSAAISAATHHKPIDLRALSQSLVPIVCSHAAFSAMTSQRSKLTPHTFSGSARSTFITQATALRDTLSKDTVNDKAASILELERKLKQS